MASRLVKNTEPYVQRFHEPYRETDMGAARLRLAWGSMFYASRKDSMGVLILLVLFFYVVSNTFVFRFQRTTLSLSMAVTKKDVPNVQKMMTPVWVGALGWVNTIILIALFIYFVVTSSWLWLATLLLYAFVGTAIIDRFIPLPSYRLCTELVMSGLRKDLNKHAVAGDEIEKARIMALMLDIKDVADVAGVRLKKV